MGYMNCGNSLQPFSAFDVQFFIFPFPFEFDGIFMRKYFRIGFSQLLHATSKNTSSIMYAVAVDSYLI